MEGEIVFYLGNPLKDQTHPFFSCPKENGATNCYLERWSGDYSETWISHVLISV
jgi:hypothetical protein